MNPVYKIVDFKGRVYWIKVDDYTYVVDPQHLELFKEIITDAVYNPAC